MHQWEHTGDQPLLHRAVLKNDAEGIARLLNKKIDVNVKNEAGLTPLHMAVEVGQLPVVHLLLGHGADINAADQQGQTPLHLAAIKGDSEIAADLLLEFDESANMADAEGRTPLHHAAANGHTEIVQALLQHDVDMHAKSHNGHTPLHEAVTHDFLETAEYLLTKGVNVDEGDNFHRTPLHVAAREGFVEMADLLIARGANVDAKDHFGRTPLHEAAMKNHARIAMLLLQRGADINSKDLLGRTAFFTSAMNNHREMMALLRKYTDEEAAQYAAPTQPEPIPPVESAHPDAIELELRRMTTRLEQQRRMFEELLTAIPDQLYIFDRNERFTYVSLSAAQALGIRQSDFVCKSWQDLNLFDEDTAALMRQCRRVIAENVTLKGELSLQIRTGEAHFEYLLSPIHRGGGDIGAVLCIAREITERKHTDEVLRRMNEQIDHRVAERTIEHQATIAKLKLDLAEQKQTEAMLRARLAPYEPAHTTAAEDEDER